MSLTELERAGADQATRTAWLEPDPRDDPRLGTWDPRTAPLSKLCDDWKRYQHSARFGYLDTRTRATVDEIVRRVEDLLREA